MRFAALAAALAVAASLTVAADDGKTYGQGVGHADEVKLTELIAHPEKYVGKSVRVEGVVVDVCTKAGCWMDLAADANSTKVRIKVKDGVMIFPVDAKGSQATAEGVFTKIQLKPDEARALAKHMAEDRGQVLDASKAENVPTVIYQIAGTGAVIK
jgi:hypothetical protein